MRFLKTQLPLKKTFYGLLILMASLSAIWCGGRYFIKYYTAQHANEIENSLKTKLGFPMTIQALSADFTLQGPVLILKQVAIQNGMNVKEVLVSPDLFQSLWQRQWQIKSVTLESPSIIFTKVSDIKLSAFPKIIFKNADMTWQTNSKKEADKKTRIRTVSGELNFDPTTETLQFKAGFAGAEIQGTWHKNQTLHCIGNIDNLDLQTVHENLMLTETESDPSWLQWLTKALSRGQVQGHFKIEGQLKNLDWQGEVQFHKVDFQYNPKWPSIQNARGSVKIDKDAVSVVVKKGNILESELKETTALITPLGTKNATVSVKGALTGRLETGLEFLSLSPLKESIYPRLAALGLSGPMDLTIQLTLPLDEKPNQVQGEVHVKEGVLNIKEFDFAVTHFNGLVAFDEKTVFTKDAHAKLEGKPVIINATPEEIKAETTVHTDFLRKIVPHEAFKFLQGETAIALSISQKDNSLTLSSDLQGVAIALPAPFSKTAETAQPLSLTVYPKVSGLQKYALQMPGIIDAKWMMTIDEQQKNIHLDLSDMLKGNISLPTGDNPQLDIELSHLKIDKESSSTKMVQDFLNGKTPYPIAFSCKNLFLNDQTMGAVLFKLIPSELGYDIQNLKVNHPAFNLQAEGNWETKTEMRTALKGQLFSANMGRTLSNLGFTAMVASGTGQIDFDFEWPDSPLNFNLKAAKGALSMQLKEGRILGVDTGFGRVFGLLSMESLQKRLQFDFSDVFQKGFEFNSISGYLRLDQGRANTQDFKVEGPQANINLRGDINLENKGLALMMRVTPKGVGNSLPLAAGLATGNPAIGLGVWFADKITGSPLNNVAQQTYRVGGTWDAPKLN